MLHQYFWIFFAERLFFSIFSNLSLILAICTISSRNPIYSIISLMGVFICGSALMILVGAEFLGLVYLMVYVGALAVLFLFVIMMLNVKTQPGYNNYNSNIFFIALIPLVSVSFFIYKATFLDKYVLARSILFSHRPSPRLYYHLTEVFWELPNWLSFEHGTRTDLSWANGVKLMYINRTGHHISPDLAEASVRFPNNSDLFYRIYRTSVTKTLRFPHPFSQHTYPSSNIEAIGLVLYLKYFIGLVSAGLILFVAMIGAILLTKYNRPSTVKSQQIPFQIASEGGVRKNRIPFF